MPTGPGDSFVQCVQSGYPRQETMLSPSSPHAAAGLGVQAGRGSGASGSQVTPRSSHSTLTATGCPSPVPRQAVATWRPSCSRSRTHGVASSGGMVQHSLRAQFRPSARWSPSCAGTLAHSSAPVGSGTPQSSFTDTSFGLLGVSRGRGGEMSERRAVRVVRLAALGPDPQDDVLVRRRGPQVGDARLPSGRRPPSLSLRGPQTGAPRPRQRGRNQIGSPPDPFTSCLEPGSPGWSGRDSPAVRQVWWLTFHPPYVALVSPLPRIRSFRQLSARAPWNHHGDSSGEHDLPVLARSIRTACRGRGEHRRTTGCPDGAGPFGPRHGSG